MRMIKLWTIVICIMMFGSWVWKPMPLWIQMFLLMIIILQVSQEIIEAINKKNNEEKK